MLKPTLNGGLVKVVDWDFEAKRARGWSAEALAFAIRDCQDCIAQNVDPDYYRDQVSVYHAEQRKRKGK